MKNVRELPDFVQRFILHWGEMGTQWGINRSVAQIHALLFLSDEPLTAEDIADSLELARSNVSNSLKELQGWGIVKKVHLPGDRRDHFTSLGDVWELFRVIATERKRREIDPTLAVLRQCATDGEATGAAPYARERIGELLELLDLSAVWFDEVSRMPNSTIERLFRMGGRLGRMLDAFRGGKSPAAGFPPEEP